ncbi:MAG: alternative cytochrome c oxidase subunit 2 [Gemmatimonadales bacterium]|nr:Alternative cytochrome c oxidase subunit 2 [bacterium HR33]GIW52190.1 MAG: alternative cytochrome c oxidase subunit 2 [Gemmatimonadales bacterium]
MTTGGQKREVFALAALFVAIAAVTVIGFAHDWKPPVASEEGARVDSLIRYLLFATGAVLVIGAAALVAFLWRYGRGLPSPAPRSDPRLERWWSLVPVLGMAVIAEVGVLVKGLPVWKRVYGAPPPGALVVEVNAQQFEWWVRYPGPDGVFGRRDPHLVDATANPLGLVPEDPAGRDDVVVRNALHLPAGRPVHVRLRSRDVLHSFSIPEFRVKQDVVPGMITAITFVPSRAGSYQIACAELCGLGHYRMGARVIVHPAEEFDTWLEGQNGALQ